MRNLIQEIEPHFDNEEYKACYTGCLIITQENKILLQQRGKTCLTYPGLISTFGGKIEVNETPLEALVRELKEELGAQVQKEEVQLISAVTEGITQHTEKIYEYFWHDKLGKITGCYEEMPCYFKNVNAVLQVKDKLMDDDFWLLIECQKRGLVY